MDWMYLTKWMLSLSPYYLLFHLLAWSGGVAAHFWHPCYWHYCASGMFNSEPTANGDIIYNHPLNIINSQSFSWLSSFLSWPTPCKNKILYDLFVCYRCFPSIKWFEWLILYVGVDTFSYLPWTFDFICYKLMSTFKGLDLYSALYLVTGVVNDSFGDCCPQISCYQIVEGGVNKTGTDSLPRRLTKYNRWQPKISQNPCYYWQLPDKSRHKLMIELSLSINF